MPENQSGRTPALWSPFVTVSLPVSLSHKLLLVAITCLINLLMCQTAVSETTVTDNQVAIVNGSSISQNTYPALTALITGRQASLTVNRRQRISGFYFGHGQHNDFNGSLVDCGFAENVCQNVTDQICLIRMDSNALYDLTPAQQLKSCATAGGVGALFIVTDNKLTRTDLFDGVPEVPAVFINDALSDSALRNLLENGSVHLEVERQVAETVLCGGIYIGDHWVLTAAHCVLEQTPDGVRQIQPWEITASVGAYDLREDKHLVLQVAEIFTAGATTLSLANRSDVAVLRLVQAPSSLRRANSFDRIAPTMKFATSETIDSQAAQYGNALALGWGSTEVREPNEAIRQHNTTSFTPLAATIALTPLDQCKALWRDFLFANNVAPDAIQINSTMLCAHEPVTQRDTCQGDSGGPLLLDIAGELTLAGITSFGLGCGSANGVPGVYTKVSAYAEWIQRTTGIDVSGTTQLSASPPVTVNSRPANFAVSGGGSVDLLVLLPLMGIVLSGLYGCQRGSSTAEDVTVVLVAPQERSAERMDILFNDDEVRLNVISNGCTTPDHFEINQDGQCIYVIERTHRDFCKRASFVMQITIPWRESSCSRQDVVFANPRLSS